MKLDQMKENLNKKFKKTQVNDAKLITPLLEDYKIHNPEEMRPYDNKSYSIITTEAKNTTFQENGTKAEETQKGHERDTKGTRFFSLAENTLSTRGTSETQKGTQLKTPVKTQPLIETYQNSCLALTGNSLKLMREIFLCCVAKQSLETGYIPKKELSRRAEVAQGSIKTTIYRLLKQKIIDNIQTTKGQGSAWNFILDKQKYEEMSLLFSSFNLTNKDTKRVTTKDTKHLSSSRNFNYNTTTKLPLEWESLDLTQIKAILSDPRYSGQFFGSQQLKLIYNSIGDKITADKIQDAIDKFAYGLKNYKNRQPYKNMEKPGAVLFSSLKEGDLWDDAACLTSKEQELKKIYDNINTKISQTYDEAFNKWVQENRKVITDKYRSTLSSSAYVSERDTYEFAQKYFNNQIWCEYRKNEMISVLGEENKSFIIKMIKLEQQLQNE